MSDADVKMPPLPEPVAWRVRGYAQFKTGKPGPWRYFDGNVRPSVNTPDCCDVEPIYTADQLRAAVLAERERCALICDSVNNHDNPMTARDCAAAIREGDK